MILVCRSDSKINGLTDYQWPQNMIVNGLILIYFPMPPLPLLFSWAVMLKARPSTLLCIGFLSTLLSNVKMRIYFDLLLEWCLLREHGLDEMNGDGDRIYITRRLISLVTTNSLAGGNMQASRPSKCKNGSFVYCIQNKWLRPRCHSQMALPLRKKKKKSQSQWLVLMRWHGGSHFAQPPEALIVTERRWHCLGTSPTPGSE